jgi:Tfp pilus assembly protein PilN
VSILINLLPDTRQAKLREKRRRQMVGGVSVLVWIVCGGIVALMTIYELGQTALIAGHTKSINDNKTKLQAVPGLMDALTAQQHLASLPGLYDKRAYMTKFLQAYTDVNPTDVTLSSMALDGQNALVVRGSAKTYASVAKLARALEAANVKIGPNAAEGNTPYFASVAIADVASASNGVGFTLNVNLNPEVTSGSGR